ncbi:hypothetical protein NDA17_003336 [Ustilago hordei]|nr:hypothetical protein NDA17_003336 [Ustilago hordei]
MEPAPASSTASPSAETSSATSKSHGALPPKDPFPEVLDWAAKVEIAEAKKAHNKAWKTECKDKVAQKKQAKLAQLDADRLAGKPPLRGCVQCKTHHWEQDPCPPKPMASPEKEASKIKSSGVGKRKHTGAEIENSGGPSKKGGPIVENPPDLPVVAAAFYEVLFAEQPTNARKGREFIDLMPKIPRALGESISAPITSTEVRAAIKGAPTENPYLHLGIPMGTDTMAQVQTLWEDVRMNFENIANKWSGAHLSLKGRVMVANSLMLSLPRYHLKFIPISTQTLKKLVKIYYDFIWVHKVHQKLHDSHALLPPERGGIGSFDLASVVTALSVEMISKLEYCGDLPWVQIQHCLLKNLHTRTQGEISSVITRPWIQRISSRELQEDVLPSCVRHLWLHWRRALNADSDTILLCSPATKQDVLNTNFWYHKDLKTLPRQGARHFSNNTYRFLADHDVTKIGDIWDADNQEVIFPAMLPNSQRRAMKQAVMTLIHDLPDSWLQLLEGNLSGTTPNNGQLCLTVVQGNLKNALPLEKVGFRLIYRQLVLKKTANVNYDHRVQPILQAYQRHTGRPGSPEMIWRTA